MGYYLDRKVWMLKGDSMSFLGVKAADSIEQYNADKVFFSCKGLDIQKGVTEGNDENVVY